MKPAAPRQTAALLAAVCLCSCARGDDPGPPADGAVRVATYNVSMYRDRAGQLAAELAGGRSQHARRIAEVLQRVRPDVVLLNEIDFDPTGDPPQRFVEGYLRDPAAEGLAGIDYPHRFTAPVNTGVPSGRDLDHDGRADGPNDSWGFGRYPGQYGMAVLSRFPIDAGRSRTFQRLLWSEQPGARCPIDPATGESYYEDGVWKVLRLPSKTFADVVVGAPGGALHLLGSHPTPPVFDGPEDRNGRRNADEIALVARYASGLAMRDDNGRTAALAASASFVVLGDLNADPTDGESFPGAIRQLLDNPRIDASATPRSAGGAAAAAARPDLNASHRGDPAEDTADFGSEGHGNLRVDYALPSKGLRITGSGVFWPKPGEPGSEAARASDHRLVWIDVLLGPAD